MTIENLDLYSQNFNYGKLVGQLEAMARFNDKTDHGHIFDLNRYSKKEKLKLSIEPSFKNFCKDYNLVKLDNPQDYLLKTLRDNWFYSYQNTNEYHLVDNGNNFSLYDFDWKTEFVQDFIKLLFDTLRPINVYKIEMKELTSYYANMWEDIAFETDEDNLWDYVLHLELHD